MRLVALLLGGVLLVLFGLAQVRMLRRRARLRRALDFSAFGGRAEEGGATRRKAAPAPEGARRTLRGSPIYLGADVETEQEIQWDPWRLANPHFLVLGGSGSGKTETLKALAWELGRRGVGVVAIDFHGDLAVEGGVTHEISMRSRYGVNPLVVDLDPDGGGPDPQRFIVLRSLKEAFAPLGGNQLSILDQAIRETYREAGIFQEDYDSWRREAPTFRHLEEVLDGMIAAGGRDRRPAAVKTKVGPMFGYGIFTKPQLPIGDTGVTRVDLSKIPSGLQYIAADALCRQLLRGFQMRGPTEAGPRMYLVVDEAKLLMPSRKEDPHAILNRIASEARKFGLGLIVASQYSGHLSRDVLMNCFAKVLLKTDKIEIPPTARRFMAERERLTMLLTPGVGLMNFGDKEEYALIRVHSYAERVSHG